MLFVSGGCPPANLRSHVIPQIDSHAVQCMPLPANLSVEKVTAKKRDKLIRLTIRTAAQLRVLCSLTPTRYFFGVGSPHRRNKQRVSCKSTRFLGGDAYCTRLLPRRITPTIYPIQSPCLIHVYHPHPLSRQNRPKISPSHSFPLNYPKNDRPLLVLRIEVAYAPPTFGRILKNA